jgi:hypothetical protein
VRVRNIRTSEKDLVFLRKETGTIVPVSTEKNMNCPNETPDQVNGISLLTKAGNRRSNFNDDDRRTIIGATRADIDAYVDLFCPDHPPYVITHSKSDNPKAWVTARGRLPTSMVLSHLVGNLIPSRNPRWVGAKTWEVTRWIGIDVDFRKGDIADFKARCKTVRRALRALGIQKEGVRVDVTPSGGKHYRFFLKHKIKVEWIEQILNNVGIFHSPGRFEIFPSMTRALRLPGSYIPGKRHDPGHILRFVRRFAAGLVPCAEWRHVVRRSRNYAAKHPTPVEAVGARAARKSPPSKTSRDASAPTCMTRRATSTPSQPLSKRQQRYLEILQQPRKTPQAIGELRRLGILLPGTRYAATKALAWHFVLALRWPPADVERELIRWVYATGATTSKDVQADLASGVRRIEDEIRALVEWCTKLPNQGNLSGTMKSLISREEVKHCLRHLRFADDRQRFQLLEFWLNFLRYAKLHGSPSAGGWEAFIHAGKVMRRWPGCSGAEYKYRRKVFEDNDLIMVSKRPHRTKNGTGRATCYHIASPPELGEKATMTVAEALVFAAQELAAQKAMLSSSSTNDTNKKVVKNNHKQLSKALGGENGGDARLIQRPALTACSMTTRPTHIHSPNSSPSQSGLDDCMSSYKARMAAKVAIDRHPPKSRGPLLMGENAYKRALDREVLISIDCDDEMRDYLLRWSQGHQPPTSRWRRERLERLFFALPASLRDVLARHLPGFTGFMPFGAYRQESHHAPDNDSAATPSDPSGRSQLGAEAKAMDQGRRERGSLRTPSCDGGEVPNENFAVPASVSGAGPVLRPELSRGGKRESFHGQRTVRTD